jgi:hypothetical protein
MGWGKTRRLGLSGTPAGDANEDSDATGESANAEAPNNDADGNSLTAWAAWVSRLSMSGANEVEVGGRT